MPFSFAPFIEIDTEFFRLSVLAVIMVFQIILGVLLPGQSHRPPHTHWFAQSLLAALSDKLNRPNRSKGSLKVRGFLSFMFMLLVAWSIARMATVLALNVQFGWLIMPFLVWGAVNVIVPWRMMRGLIAQKTPDDLLKNSAALSDLTGLSFKGQDGHTVARASVFYGAFSLLRYMVAPMLFYAVFGIMGLMLYVFASVSFRKFDVYLYGPFARLFVVSENLLDFVPARLTAMILYFAAFITPTGHPQKSLHCVYDGAQKFPGLSLGTVFKSYAGACDVSLGGAIVYKDSAKILLPWIGPNGASAQAGIAEVKRGFLLHVYATIFVLLGILGIMVI